MAVKFYRVIVRRLPSKRDFSRLRELVKGETADLYRFLRARLRMQIGKSGENEKIESLFPAYASSWRVCLKEGGREVVGVLQSDFDPELALLYEFGSEKQRVATKPHLRVISNKILSRADDIKKRILKELVK